MNFYKIHTLISCLRSISLHKIKLILLRKNCIYLTNEWLCFYYQNRETIVDFFSEYGKIILSKYFPNQSICYVKFQSREQACKAILEASGMSIETEVINCVWGSMPSEPEDHFDARPLKYSEVNLISKFKFQVQGVTYLNVLK